MLYKVLIRPILFFFSPEAVHHFVVSLLKFMFSVPGLKNLVSKIYSVDNKLLEKEIFGIKFNNPVGLAAGFDKNAEMYNELACFGFSFIEIGTVTPLAQPGNPKPRSFRLVNDKALINRMGMNNHGVYRIAENL